MLYSLAVQYADSVLEEVSRTDLPFMEPLQKLIHGIQEWFVRQDIYLLYFALGVIFSLLAGYCISKIFCFILKCFSGHEGTVSQIIEVSRKPIFCLLITVGIYFSIRILELPVGLAYGLRKIFFTIVTLIIFSGLARISNCLFKRFLEKAKARKASFDNILISLLNKAVKTVIWIIAVLFTAQNIFNLQIGTILAGAGVFAMALAFAAQNTIANIFGAISLVLDKPFSIGDFIEIGGKSGTVESVGLRSTKIRSVNGTQFCIPNKEMTDATIENISRRPSIKQTFDFGLTYGTAPEKMSRAIEILHEIFDASPLSDNEKASAKIAFTEMKDWSLNLQVIMWMQTRDFFEMMAERSRLNNEVLKRFNAEGLDFAFPTSTAYLETEHPLEAQIQLSAHSTNKQDTGAQSVEKSLDPVQ